MEHENTENELAGEQYFADKYDLRFWSRCIFLFLKSAKLPSIGAPEIIDGWNAFYGLPEKADYLLGEMRKRRARIESLSPKNEKGYRTPNGVFVPQKHQL